MMSDINNQNSCSQKPCQSGQFRPNLPNTGSDDKNPDLSGRPVLYTGVLWIGILRRFLIPRPVTDSRPCCSRKARDMPEAKDVALITPTNTSSGRYVQPSAHAHYQSRELTQKQDQLSKQEERESKHSPLATLVYQIHEASVVLKGEARQLSDDLSELVQDGKTTTAEKLQTLRADEAVAGRYGAVTITSLLGYMAGMRRSVAVRLVYAATGAVAAATLCYPEEARYFNNIALARFREGVLISVQLLRFGPQKTLAVKDSSVDEEIPTSRKSKETTRDSYFKPSQKTDTTSNSNNDNTASHEKIVGGFERRKKDHLRLNSENTSLEQSLSFLEQQEAPSKTPDIPRETVISSKFSAHEGKLSRECQRDRSIIVPYSPALPVPPKMMEPDYFQNSNTYNDYHNLPKTNPNDSLRANLKEKAAVQPSILVDPYSSLQVDPSTSHPECKTRPTENSNLTENNGVLSARDPTKVAVTDTSKNENLYKSQNYPLNKKLSRYYVNRKKEPFTPSEAEYDDLCTKSKRKENH